MNSEAIKALAISEGFARAYVTEAKKCMRPGLNRYNEGVADDPEALLPGARCAIVLLYAYKPYFQEKEQAQVSAYYLASNRAYHAARTVAQAITASGYRAVSNAQIAIKPFLLSRGIGEACRNSLVSVEDIGTRFHVQIVLTDAPLETDALSKKPAPSNLCLTCGACRDACPAGAISGFGEIDAEKCLRARDDGEIVEENNRAKYENRLLGCDVCQNVCPKNSAVGGERPPEELLRALELSELLSGNVRPLIPLIGRNYARKARIRMKAALVAANLGRRDTAGYLRQMAEEGTPGERAHAQWALRVLLGEEET